jgi:hypothetical protein
MELLSGYIVCGFQNLAPNFSAIVLEVLQPLIVGSSEVLVSTFAITSEVTFGWLPIAMTGGDG